MLLHAITRAARDGGLRYLLDRCAIGKKPRSTGGSACLWIHAASVGEINTVAPLIRRVSEHRPELPLLVTTTTPTGAQILADHSLPGVEHAYLPMDTGGACHRFLSSRKILALWIVETEIWPWMLARCRQRSIPVTIVNARLSSRTMRHAHGVRGQILCQALQNVRILARSKADAQRYRQLGAEPGLISTIGDLKHAQSALQEVGAIGSRPIERRYVLAASTHDDEELSLATRWVEQNHTGLLVIAPRHPERGPDIRKRLGDRGIDCALRSLREPLDADHRVYLADTLGELMIWYTHAQAAFVGGSLIARGGHNVLEAASVNCPVIVGPHTDNFQEIVSELDNEDAIVTVSDASEAVSVLTDALNDQEPFQRIASRAMRIARSHAGVLDHYVERLLTDSQSKQGSQAER